jgi:hypothetical protein
MARIIFILLVIITQLTYGQNLAQPLLIGDKVPNLTIGTDMYNPAKQIKLHDLKAPLILLDFWSVTCSGCVKSVPKMEALQNSFGSRVKILTITTDKLSAIKKMLGRLNITLPQNLIRANTSLLHFFPFSSLPHHVWLDSNYRIAYITHGFNATAGNFTSFLKGIQMPFAAKYEFEKFDKTQPLWIEANNRLPGYLRYYSYLVNFVKGYSSIMGRISDSTKDQAGFRAYNQPLLTIIKAAWGKFPERTFENNNRVLLNVWDSSVFIQPADGNRYTEWATKNAYSYELRMPFAKKNELFTIMQQDILRFFDYDISIQKIKRACYILVRTSAEDKLKTKGAVKTTPASKDSIVLLNLPLKNFVQGLNRELDKPCIDETGYTGNVDLRLGCWYTDINKLKKELHKYGLDLVEEERVIDILVIKDKEGS